jgi:hypothetical protein
MQLRQPRDKNQSQLTQNRCNNASDHLRNIDLSFQPNSLQLILENQHIVLVVVVRARWQWNQLIVLGYLFENAWLENLVFEEGSDDDASLWVVFVEL